MISNPLPRTPNYQELARGTTVIGGVIRLQLPSPQGPGVTQSGKRKGTEEEKKRVGGKGKKGEAEEQGKKIERRRRHLENRVGMTWLGRRRTERRLEVKKGLR